MELFDIYDVNRILTGRTGERGQPLSAGDYRLVVHVSMINRKGEMLIQQRQPFKAAHPNLWDVTVGGSALAGETSQDAIVREVREEIGLTLERTHLRPSLTMNFEEGFDDHYVVYQEVDLADLQLQTSEVQAVKWASLAEVKAMITSGEFIPYSEELLALLFASKDNRGIYREAKA